MITGIDDACRNDLAVESSEYMVYSIVIVYNQPCFQRPQYYTIHDSSQCFVCCRSGSSLNQTHELPLHATQHTRYFHAVCQLLFVPLPFRHIINTRAVILAAIAHKKWIIFNEKPPGDELSSLFTTTSKITSPFYFYQDPMKPMFI